MKMGLIVMCYVEQGIAIAADHRVVKEGHAVVEPNTTAYHFNNHVNKIVPCANGCVVAHIGDDTIDKEPLYIWTQRFVNSCIEESTKCTEMPQLLLNYFKTLPKVDRDEFIIAGYDEHGQKHCYQIQVNSKEINEFDTSKNGYFYTGCVDFALRLLEKSELIYEDGYKEPAMYYPPIINEFTLQDAVNFSRFLVDTTKQMQQFIRMPQITGGSTDVIVLTKDETKWIQKEEVQ